MQMSSIITSRRQHNVLLLLVSATLSINLSLWDFSLRNSILTLTKIDGLLVLYLRFLILLSNWF